MLARGERPASAGRTVGVVALAEALEVEAGIRQRQKRVRVHALVAWSPVEALDVGVLARLARLDEGQRDIGVGRRGIEAATAEFRGIPWNAVPWSSDSARGAPRGAITASSAAVTASAGRLCAATSARQSCVAISTTVRTRNRRPFASLSLMKSMPHVSFGATAGGRGTRGTASCFRRRRRTASPSSRYRRSTRLEFTWTPSRWRRQCRRGTPHRGYAAASSRRRARRGASRSGRVGR